MDIVVRLLMEVTHEAIMDARPMEDQRGEKVLLDVNTQGRLEWITVV